ncbi:histidine triad nucleotide-binding protein [Peptoniphilus obesi]|uniref:histidine triad nucleotide-binding protein n=1 Tax=Peptoniphilus obesi TaxID=1472765 RepID=UPI0004B0AB9B|nr:histidine triad nucleotide-binding protein [Peptoniphilus obesi]
MDCLFCKIISGEIPSNKVYEDEKIYAFKDIDPQAPVHILIIPKKHIDSLDEIDESDSELLSYILLKIKDLAKEFELDKGYRVVINTKEDGGQSVNHLHFHLLGKRSLQWPPG